MRRCLAPATTSSRLAVTETQSMLSSPAINAMALLR